MVFSVFSLNLKSRALLSRRDGSRSHHMDTKRLFNAQNVWPHQIPKRPYLQEEDMPVAFSIPRHVAKLEHQREKKVSGGSEQHPFSRLPEGHIDNRSSGTLQKVQNRKADCFALLRRIPHSP